MVQQVLILLTRGRRRAPIGRGAGASLDNATWRRAPGRLTATRFRIHDNNRWDYVSIPGTTSQARPPHTGAVSSRGVAWTEKRRKKRFSLLLHARLPPTQRPLLRPRLQMWLPSIRTRPRSPLASSAPNLSLHSILHRRCRHGLCPDAHRSSVRRCLGRMGWRAYWASPRWFLW